MVIGTGCSEKGVVTGGAGTAGDGLGGLGALHLLSASIVISEAGDYL